MDSPRPGTSERNAGKGSDYLSVNLRLSRSAKLGTARVEGVVEAFNVTNRRNILTRNTNFGTGAYPLNPVSTFNQPTAVADARTFQFALRVRF